MSGAKRRAGGGPGPGGGDEVHADRARVRELIRSPLSDGDTLDPFAARQDKEYAFAPGRGAALAYRPLFGVALGSGDPIGARDQFLDCLRRFVDHSDELGLRPVTMLVRQDRLLLYQYLGFKTFYLGDEAIVDVAGFTLDNPRMRNARQAVKRSQNFGVTTEVMREGDITPSAVASLREITVRARRGRREEGFSAALEEPFTIPQPSCLVVLCRDREGTLIGFQRYSFCNGDTGARCTQRRERAHDLRGSPVGQGQRDRRALSQLRRLPEPPATPRRGHRTRPNGACHPVAQSRRRADAVHLHREVPAPLGPALPRVPISR
jgi:hypothetical protein